jgi:hypothetical protein
MSAALGEAREGKRRGKKQREGKNDVVGRLRKKRRKGVTARGALGQGDHDEREFCVGGQRA